MFKKVCYAYLLILTLLAISIYSFATELTWVKYIDGVGSITTGKKFGISIGDPESTIAGHLRNLGLQIDERTDPPRCARGPVGADYTLQSYEVSWPGGAICIGITAGKVSSINWWFNGFES